MLWFCSKELVCAAPCVLWHIADVIAHVELSLYGICAVGIGAALSPVVMAVVVTVACGFIC